MKKSQLDRTVLNYLKSIADDYSPDEKECWIEYHLAEFDGAIGLWAELKRLCEDDDRGGDYGGVERGSQGPNSNEQ